MARTRSTTRKMLPSTSRTLSSRSRLSQPHSPLTARPSGGDRNNGQRAHHTSIQNGPRRLKRVKALHWQTPARGSFDPQRFSGALANRLTALLGGGGKFGDQP